MTRPVPIDAYLLAHGGRGFAELLTDGPAVYWVEHRPTQGRSVLMAAGRHDDLTPAPWSVGSRVHEYGGAAALVRDGTAYFVEVSDQRIYRLPLGDRRPAPRPLTPPDGRRYGDLDLDRDRGRLLAVCEDHRAGGRPDNCLVAISTHGGEPWVLESGRDFYLAPRISPDGRRLAWVAWDLPNMPWDGTDLYVAELADDGRCGPAQLIAGGPDESVCHPKWSPDGVLYFVSDRSGWWNLYAWDGSEVAAVAPMTADVGAATAMGGLPYDVGATHVVAAVRSGGRARLVRFARGGEPTAPAEELLPAAWEVDQPRFAGDDVTCLAGGPTRPIGVWRWTGRAARPLRDAVPGGLDRRLLVEPEVLTVPTTDGAATHALYYPPTRRVDDRLPALVVIAHGGPVTAATAALALGEMTLMAAAYWTSRGYAVVDVNYRGSTGYGRRYREALHGRWGVADVDDCVAVARHLVETDRADGDRVALRGWSAGGYTVLMALALRDVFAAGTAYFPVADLEAVHAWANAGGHKYEAGYDHRLIGDWDHDREQYRRRSPLRHADRIAAPLLVVQGLDDMVCPASQTQRLVDALRARSHEVDYLAIPGEGHGFRRADSIVDALETEDAFYARALGGASAARTASTCATVW